MSADDRPRAAGSRVDGPRVDRPPVEQAAARSPEGRRRRRRRWLVLGLVVGLALGADLVRAPERQVSARVLLGAIDLYQASLSPLLGAGGVRCRFEPSCSRYAEGAIARHGALVGSGRSLGRILRCGPWTPYGTVDPP